ncbi:MAG: TonB-dependent receptor [Bacteroidales bacterium]|nr:TonB-dependent receptor [Bacteroidales bacterium]
MAKRSIIYIVSLLLLQLLNVGQAEAQQTKGQQTIDPTVEVQRDFDGQMMNIHKSRLNTSIHDSLSSFNLSFNYSIFDKPYKDLYEFSPLPSADLQGKAEEKYPVFFAKAGVSFPFSPDASVWVQPRLGNGNSLNINMYYNGFFGKLNTLKTNPQTMEIEKDGQVKSYAGNSSFGAGATYGHQWKKGELYIDLGYNSNYNTYYGFNTENIFNTATDPFYKKIEKSSFMKDSCSHKWQQAGIKFHIGSTDAKGRGAKLHYKAEASFLHTTDKPAQEGKLNENCIKVSGEIGPTFGRYNKFTVGVNSENVIYSGIQEYKYGLYEIIPQYSFEKGRLKVLAGIKISGRYKSKDETDRYHNTFFVKGDLSFEIARNTLWLYAKADGWNALNSYSSIIMENRWISQEADLKASSVPLMLQGGFKGQVHNKFSYNVYARYTVHEGLLQYIGGILPAAENNNYYDSRLNTIYSNHREFTVGGRFGWESKHFSAGTTLEYSDYTKSKNSTLQEQIQPIGYAPFKWHLYATYNYRQRIWAGIVADYRSSTPTWSATWHESNLEYKSFLNLGINVKYAINRMVSVFATGENLLDKQIQYYPQYLEKGISFGFGVLVKL